MTQTKVKDPDAVKDYLLDASDEMVKTTDTISAIVGAIIVAPTGLTVGSGTPPAPSIVSGTSSAGATVASSAVRVWLSGGTVDTTYKVTARVTTAGGRTLDLSGYVLVAQT